MRSSAVRILSMAKPNEIEIEIAYARPEVQRVITLHVQAGITARAALLQSGLADEFPQIDAAGCPIGVFGKPVGDDHVLGAGDRLEVYRSLEMEPREARRRLAARGQTMGRANRSGG